MDDAISGLEANPDIDDYNNLLEYVFDGNPKVLTQPQIHVDYEYDQEGNPMAVKVDFPWANGVTDATYTLQVSQDMNDWVELTSTMTGSEDQGLVTRIELSADLPTGESNFVRLLVSTE